MVRASLQRGGDPGDREGGREASEPRAEESGRRAHAAREPDERHACVFWNLDVQSPPDRRQRDGREVLRPVMSRPKPRLAFRTRKPETEPRSCGNQPAHESLFNRRLQSLPPAVCACLFNRVCRHCRRQDFASEFLTANMRAACRTYRFVRGMGYHCGIDSLGSGMSA